MFDLAKEKMPELLKNSGQARQQSIKLGGLPFANDLSKNLLDLAIALEGLYEAMRDAVTAENERLVQKLIHRMEAKEAECEKAKAGIDGVCSVCFQSDFNF